MPNPFQQSLAAGPHAFLKQLVGDWQGSTRTWFEPDKLVDESATRMTIRSALDDRFVIIEYEGSIQGKPMLGHASVGFDLTRNRYEMAWCDSFHNSTAIMYLAGEPGDHTFSVHGSYPVGEGHPDWGWRIVLELIGDGALAFTHYNVPPSDVGPEYKGVETSFKRA